MQKSSFGVMGVMIVLMMLSGCAGTNLSSLDKEGFMAKPGKKVFFTYDSDNCPSEQSGITCLTENEGTEEGMLAYAKEYGTSVLVMEQRKTSSGAASKAAWTIARIGGAAVGGAAGQGFAIGTAGAGGGSSSSIEFTIVVNDKFSKVDCDDMSTSECRTNLQRLMMGQKIYTKSNSSDADAAIKAYMKKNE